MTTMNDVPQGDLIEAVAKELQKDKMIKEPTWAPFVKTGANKERPPTRKDWWYVRCASVLRSIRVRGPVGVGKLRVKYGGKRNMGMKPERFYKSSGNILRKALQQLEAAGYAKSVEKDGHKGRIATPKGIALFDKTAAQIAKK